MQYIIDNRKNEILVGKFKGRTYNHFYYEATEYHKRHFLNSKEPDDEIKGITEYIQKRDYLPSVGYNFVYPAIVRSKFVFTKVVKDICNVVSEPEPEPTKPRPELVLLSNEEMAVIRQNDKRKYEEPYSRK